MKYLESCQKIWRGYKMYAEGASVIRKGFEMFGVAVCTDDALDLKSTFYRRSESDLEHQAKVAWLASAFLSHFPDYFGVEPNFNGGAAWLFITTVLCHDVGEVAIGDIPDTGMVDVEAKEKAEYEVLKSFVETYNFVDAKGLLDMFRSFQKKDTVQGQALYALDKAEAVLTHLVLESYGLKGRFSLKNNPSCRDKAFVEKYGIDTAADLWGEPMSRAIKDYPSNIRVPILTLLSVAARDVRGEEFIWLKNLPSDPPGSS